MKQNPLALVLALTMMAAGCSSADTPDAEKLAGSTDTMFGAAGTAFSNVGNPNTPRRAMISAQGIGIVHRGMTLGEVRAAAHDSLIVGPADDGFMVDVPAIPVIVGSDTIYHLLFTPGTAITDKTPVDAVATMDEAVRTAEDVGPGSLLSYAAGKYGLAVLQYNANDESREYASFASKPNDSMTFRVDAGPGRDGFAGIYETHGEYNRTVKYRKDARIMMVVVKL